MIDNPFAILERRINRLESLSVEIRELILSLRSPTVLPPVVSAKEVREMTGWPEGTFYLKVSQMPEGIVIRGKSKRLLFDREKLYAWLKSPVNVI